MARERLVLDEGTPSIVRHLKYGSRETEKVILTGEGISMMINQDGSLVVEVYTTKEAYQFKLSPDDVKSQSHLLKQWRELR